LNPNQSKSFWVLDETLSYSNFFENSIFIETIFSTLPDCVLITLNNFGQTYYYNPLLDISVNFQVPNSGGGLNPWQVAHTNDNLWLLYPAPFGFRYTIREWNISGQPPYTISPNYRLLDFPSNVPILNNSWGLSVAGPNKLVFVDYDWNVWELSIPAPPQTQMSGTIKFTLPQNSNWTFMITSDGKFLNGWFQEISGVYYIGIDQYDYNTGNFEFRSQIQSVSNSSFNNPLGIAQFEGKTYLFTLLGIYKFEMNSPFGGSFVHNTQFVGASSLVSCSFSSYPSVTPTPTITPTQTNTPTPTPTITPSNTPASAPYNISSGDSVLPLCDPKTLTQTIYSSELGWFDVIVGVTIFYTDSSLTTPFDGGNLWYTNSTDSLTGYYRVDNSGLVIEYEGPC
jgi:hypothetical protein